MVLETENAPVDEYLDARGLTCPMPLLKTKLALNGMQPGQVLKVSATDAGSQRDFQRFAELSGHALLRSEQAAGEYHYWLRKS